MSLNDFTRTNALEADALFVLPEARSVLTPVSQTEPKTVPVKRLQLTRVPKAMRNMGWSTAARLMERWFSMPAWELSETEKHRNFDKRQLLTSQFDDTIVTMGWAMQFSRFRDAIVEVERTSFHTAKGLERLNSLLSEWDGDTPYRLGYYGMPTRSFDHLCQVNTAVFGHMLDTLDGMYGALGVANLKIGVIGTAVRENNQRYFHVEHVGLYVLDYYDFNGPQYLGTWTEDRVLTKGEAAFSETYTGKRVVQYREGAFARVTNADFRDFRRHTGRGGDFVVFSDILWKRSNAVVNLNAQP